VVEVVPTTRCSVVHDYDDTGAVHGALAAAGVTVIDTAYDQRVTVTFEVPEPEAEALSARLVDRTSGRADVQTPDRAASTRQAT
jgi:putative IMPACT (imprinted ancient) family translation regulator